MKKRKQINKMLFYFITDDNIEKHLSTKSVINRKNEVVRIWKNDKDVSNELIFEVKHLMDKDENIHIMSSFVLDKNFYGEYGLNFNQSVLLPKNNLEEIGFSLNNVRIHCFQSNINFIELDYVVNSDDPKVINNFNYFMSEVKSNVVLKLSYKKLDENNEVYVETKELTVLDFILSLIKDFGTLNDMDFKGELSYKSLKPLLVSYLFTENSTDVNEFESNLGHNYKESYNLNENHLRKTEYFNNSTWYYTVDSISNITYSTDNALTNTFFSETFTDKVNKLYFPLVLLAAHQKLYCLYVYHKLLEINIDFTTAEELKNKCDEFTAIKANFDKMSLYYFFDNPSFIEHVNVFYSNVVEAFGVETYKKAVYSKTNTLIEFSNQCSKLLANYKEKKESKRKIIYDIFAIITASVFSFASLYDTFLKFLKNINVSFGFTDNILIFSGFAVVCLIIPFIYNLANNMKKLKKSKAEIAETEKKIKDVGVKIDM